MKKLFNKKGSHVGIVLSFVIFVTFVIFIFSILEPRIKINQGKETLLENIKMKFVDEVSAEFLTTGIFVTTSDECDLILVDLDEINSLNAIAKNKDGNIVGSKEIGNDFEVDWNEIDNFFKVYSAEEDLYDYSSTGMDVCDGVDIQISSTRGDKYVFEDKIVDFITTKNFDSLNIPEGTYFNVTFEDAEGNIIGELQNPGESVSVYSDRFSVQYFDKEANIKTGFITIRIY